MNFTHRAISRSLAVSLLVGLVIAGGCFSRPAHADETANRKQRPNIVFILADDLGWRDLGCYGGTFRETPRLDTLAKQGMRFTDAYAPAPICSASRASILTGRTPARLHFEFVTKSPEAQPPVRGLRPPPYTLDLPLEEVTLAEILEDVGYTTG
jgi:uncharacterized sulfatase